MSRSTWVQIVGVGLLVLLSYAFYAQNSLRVAELSLDLGFVAWRLSEPIPVPLLMLLCFLAGALPVMLWTWWRTSVLRAEVRKLRQQQAVDDRSRDGWK